MKSIQRLHGVTTCLVALTMTSVITAAQAPAPAPAVTADDEFALLEVASRPVAVGKVTNPSEFARAQKAQSVGFLNAAEKARAFYQKYPAHAKSSEAKKIEAIAMIRAVNTGASSSEPKMRRLVSEFRNDNKHASKDRFDVAIASVQSDVMRKPHANRAEETKEFYNRALDLYGEFPSEAAVYEIFVGVARNADPELARTAARQLLSMPAPDQAKKEAQAVIDRLDMPGRPIDLEWQDQSGKSYRIADFKGKIVVFYVWASWAAESLEADVAKALGAGMQLVTVNVDDETKNLKQSKAFDGLNPINNVEGKGLDSALAQQLRVLKVPAVHVVDARGFYVGAGTPAQLASLLAKAGK